VAVKGRRSEATAAAAPVQHVSLDAVIAGAGAVNVRREAVTSQQALQLKDIQVETKQQDAILDDMSRIVGDLHLMATEAQGEVQHSMSLMEGTLKSVSKAQVHMDHVSDGAHRALTKLNASGSRICLYLVCVSVLLSLGLVLSRVWHF
jgi:hypothetical protein